MPECPDQWLMGANWCSAWGYLGCPSCLDKMRQLEECKALQWTVGVSLGFVGVDWEVDWGVMDTMLSLIVPEVARIIQHCQKGVMGHNSQGLCHGFRVRTWWVLWSRNIWETQGCGRGVWQGCVTELGIGWSLLRGAWWDLEPGFVRACASGKSKIYLNLLNVYLFCLFLIK